MSSPHTIKRSFKASLQSYLYTQDRSSWTEGQVERPPKENFIGQPHLKQKLVCLNVKNKKFLLSSIHLLTWIFWKLYQIILATYIPNKTTLQSISSQFPKRICVGGGSFGGSGKTEVVCFLANLFVQQGFRVQVWCHGYTGRCLHPTRLTLPSHCVSDLSTVTSSSFTHPKLNCNWIEWSEEWGDEALLLRLQLSHNIEIWSGGTWQDKLQMIPTDQHDIIVCDGGLFSTQLPRDLTFCLLDPHLSWKTLPYGSLRLP